MVGIELIALGCSRFLGYTPATGIDGRAVSRRLRDPRRHDRADGLGHGTPASLSDRDRPFRRICRRLRRGDPDAGTAARPDRRADRQPAAPRPGRPRLRRRVPLPLPDREPQLRPEDRRRPDPLPEDQRHELETDGHDVRERRHSRGLRRLHPRRRSRRSRAVDVLVATSASRSRPARRAGRRTPGGPHPDRPRVHPGARRGLRRDAGARHRGDPRLRRLLHDPRRFSGRDVPDARREADVRRRDRVHLRPERPRRAGRVSAPPRGPEAASSPPPFLSRRSSSSS